MSGNADNAPVVMSGQKMSPMESVTDTLSTVLSCAGHIILPVAFSCAALLALGMGSDHVRPLMTLLIMLYFIVPCRPYLTSLFSFRAPNMEPVIYTTSSMIEAGDGAFNVRALADNYEKFMNNVVENSQGKAGKDKAKQERVTVMPPKPKPQPPQKPKFEMRNLEVKPDDHKEFEKFQEELKRKMAEKEKRGEEDAKEL